MPRGIGRPQRGARAVGKFVHEIALGGGESLPVLECAKNVRVARQNPHPRFLAPEARVLIAQRAVEGKRIRIPDRRVWVEAEHLEAFQTLASVTIRRRPPPRPWIRTPETWILLSQRGACRGGRAPALPGRAELSRPDDGGQLHSLARSL